MEKAAMIFLLLLLHSCINAQSAGNNKNTENKKATTNPLAGTWRIVEYTDLDTLTGKWIDRYGKNPRGYFTYTKTNILNLNISTGKPEKISEDSAKRVNVNLFDNMRDVSFGYFGTYSLDLEKSIVTHHVRGGSIPWYIDTDQPRPFILKGDTLIITNHKSTKRVLVRVD
jgi:PBP1b-binding outer membrane lipoprotein LpoB